MAQSVKSLVLVNGLFDILKRVYVPKLKRTERTQQT